MGREAIKVLVERSKDEMIKYGGELEQWRHVLEGRVLSELLEDAAESRGHDTYAIMNGDVLTLAQFSRRVRSFASGLVKMGVQPGDRVAVMLPQHPDHAIAIFALISIHAIWVGVNTRLRGPALSHVITHSDSSVLIFDEAYREQLDVAKDQVWPHRAVVRSLKNPHAHELDFDALFDDDELVGQINLEPDDVIGLIYTSGTTGPAKGVQVTDRMLRAAALGCVAATGVEDGDVLFLWEPLCHIGGAQVLVMPLLKRTSLAFVEKLSISKFWAQARESGSTQIHQLGGVLQMLLSQPPSKGEREHKIRVAWGGGVTAEVWRAAEKRFGLSVSEAYGMTEASSIVSVNNVSPEQGVGPALPYFEVRVCRPGGESASCGEAGEILIRSKLPGLITPGYFRDDAETEEHRLGDWWRTGDRGKLDQWGNLHFLGRATDSVRHRGENVSAWEVESIVNEHPSVAESAMIGVQSESGDQDIKVFVTPAEGHEVNPEEIINWCQTRSAAFQVPRYIEVITSFAKTPSQRIIKSSLPTTTVGCFDRMSSSVP